ncbi:glycosyltransferase family 39 protein [Dactylosporangium sp. NPDC000244]|uniref:ArnT family glycosyltransferase n=1 Tax=Dactylosporangium sp. NPDC000244 TaxID=3154365 RepID=UPI003323E403
MTSAFRFWRSPEGQPAWARPALLAVAALAAVLYAWRIRDSGFALFYSVAAKSMSVSWKAFFYGALDPGATVTIDKLAGSFAPQAISARIFGYHAWSLTLPQVVEGVIAVLVMYRIGRRLAGPAAGLLAAGLFGLTPVVASMFGHPMEDGLLTMALVLAADAFQRALLEGRLRSLLLSGVWIGVGFQAKMMQAWMVLPAMALTYLVAAPGPWRRRLGHLGAAGVVMLAASLSWVALYELTPDAWRPYVDGSTNNSALAMVFGYNGFDRFGLHVPGAVESMFTGAGPGGANAGGPGGGFEPPAGRGMGGEEGLAKLFGQRYGTQIGSLYPLAMLGLVAGIVARGRAPRTDPERAGLLFWGLWLVTVAAVFSAIMVPHTAYMASLAPPLAALSASALVRGWRGLRDRPAAGAAQPESAAAPPGWRGRAAAGLLPVLVVAEVVWAVYLSLRFPDFLPWLPWAIAAAALLALPVLVAAAVPRAPRPRRAVLRAAMVLAIAATVAAPSAWAASVLHPHYGGSAFDASAGPVGAGFGDRRGAGPPEGLPGAPGGGFPGGEPPDVRRMVARGGPGGGFGGGPFGETSETLTADQRRLDDYLVAHRDGARYLAAATSWSAAAPYIMATGRPYLPMGGFSGSVPSPTLAGVQRLVARGELHYVLLSGAGEGRFGFRPGRTGGTTTAIADWVRADCAAVPDDVGVGDQELYRCG